MLKLEDIMLDYMSLSKQKEIFYRRFKHHSADANSLYVH